jgi:hypothetical protein
MGDLVYAHCRDCFDVIRENSDIILPGVWLRIAKCERGHGGEMNAQISLPVTETKVYHIPQFIHCEYHGDWDPRPWYDDDEIIEMLEEQGYIDCAICDEEIVGIGSG